MLSAAFIPAPVARLHPAYARRPAVLPACARPAQVARRVRSAQSGARMSGADEAPPRQRGASSAADPRGLGGSMAAAEAAEAAEGEEAVADVTGAAGEAAVAVGKAAEEAAGVAAAVGNVMEEDEAERETEREAEKEAEKEAERAEEAEKAGKGVRQLLGIKGADGGTAKWRIRLQLMKPVTWVPLVWGVTCGAAASGNFHWGNPVDVEKSLACMLLAGPLLTGYTQVINDWYDREIDAINEPYRPIPSGIVSEGEVKAQIAILLIGGLLVSAALDVWAGHPWPVNTALTVFGSFIAYIYSAPPLKLKQNGWLGSYALGASYISLPWWAGQALFGTLDWKTMVLTLFYSFAGLGIAIINDFKSVEGDRATGMQSLPVMFGVDTAKWICVGMIDVFQLLVAGILYGVGEKAYAAAIVGLVAPQMFLQAKYFLKDPIENDVKYQASAQPFLVIGILVAGLAVGHHGPL